MANLKFPIAEVGGTMYQVQVDTSIYDKDTVTAAAYKFTGKYYVHQQVNMADNKVIEVIFESKDESAVTDSDVKQFCNELIDQQIRHNTNAQFGHIRDMIVQEAFKPVTSK